MRSALIIGASGQDGQLLTPLLWQRGYSVHGWTRSQPTPATRCACDQINLLNAGEVERELRSLQPDEIYYLAAFHHSTEERVRLSDAELLERSCEVHVIGLQNVLQAMAARSALTRLFYAASSHVFGPSTAGRQDEKTPLAPDSAYGISKAAGIRCCQLYREEEGLFAATGILFNHESPLRKPTFLSQKIVRGALRARRVPGSKLILGDLEARVDWGYAPDYVDAMFRILQLPAASDFVIATGTTHTVREFAEIAFGAVGLDWREHVETDRSLLNKTSQTLCGDAGKLRVATGWSPTVGFAEMVRTLVREAEGEANNVLPMPAMISRPPVWAQGQAAAN